MDERTAYNTKVVEHKDALDRPIEVGDVIAHISRKGSGIHTDPGIVTQLLPNGSLVWSRVGKNWSLETHTYVYAFRIPTTIYRTDFCVIVDLDEIQLMNKYGIPVPTCSECGFQSTTWILESGKCASCEAGV